MLNDPVDERLVSRVLTGDWTQVLLIALGIIAAATGVLGVVGGVLVVTGLLCADSADALLRTAAGFPLVERREGAYDIVAVASVRWSRVRSARRRSVTAALLTFIGVALCVAALVLVWRGA